MNRSACLAVAILLAMVALSCVSLARGQNCATVVPGVSTTYSASHVQAVVKKEVAVVKEVPVFTKYVAVIPLVEFPTYSAVYVPTPAYAPQYAQPQHPQAPQPAATPMHNAGAEMRQVLDLLQKMDRRIEALEGHGVRQAPAPPMPQAQAAGGNAPAVAQAKCAVCHTRGKEDAGGGFVLLEADGSRAKLNARGFREMARRINNGTMPPRSNKVGVAALTDEEASLLVDDLRNYPER